LRLDVVADDRKALRREALLPVGFARDEDRDAVDERAPRLEDLLDIPLRGLFAAHGEVAHHDVDLPLAQAADDVTGLAWRLLDDLREVLADAVVGHPATHLDPGPRHVREA